MSVFLLFLFLLHILKLFSTLFIWINLVLLFLRLTTLYRRLQSPFRSRLRPESGAKYGYPDLRSFPVHSFHVVLYVVLSNVSALSSVNIITSTQHLAGSLCQCSSSPTCKERFREEQGRLAHRTPTKETITVS